MVAGNRVLRSVDSQRVGRVIEPRKRLSVVADAVENAEGNIRRVVMAWPFEPTGVREQGTYAAGLPRNLGGPATSSEVNRYGEPRHPQRSPDVRGIRASGGERRCQRRYSTAKATELWGTSDGESECLVVPLNGGNRSPRDPREGRGHRQMEPQEGTTMETSSSKHVLPKLQRIATLARDAPDMVCERSSRGG